MKIMAIWVTELSTLLTMSLCTGQCGAQRGFTNFVKMPLSHLHLTFQTKVWIQGGDGWRKDKDIATRKGHTSFITVEREQ